MIKLRYNDIANQIEADIQANVWSDKLPGISVLADRYQVAGKTASKAIGVLAQRGLVTVQGTRGTYISKAQNSRPTYHTIGVVDASTPARHAEDVVESEITAANLGYGLMSLGLPAKNLSRCLEYLHHAPVDGLIVGNSILTPKIITGLRREGMPFVSLNRIERVPGVIGVDYDNERATEIALAHLLEHGHRRIAFIGFHYAIDECHQRLQAVYERVLTQAGCYQSDLWMGEHDFATYWEKHLDRATHAYGREMARRALSKAQPPTAYWVSNYAMALGVWEELRACGVNVPRDASIVALSTTEREVGDNPFLTYVFCSAKSRMRCAVKTLVNRIAGDDCLPTQQLIPAVLTPRLSVKPPKDSSTSCN